MQDSPPLRPTAGGITRRKSSSEDNMEFTMGQRVLCRDEDYEKWYPHIFCKCIEKTEYNEHFLVFGGWTFRQCIPLKGNEALIYNDGDSPDQPEKPKPVITEYGFLEPVEAYSADAGRWMPAVYVRGDKSKMPHMVLFIDKKTTDWLSEAEVRRAVPNG